MMRTEKHLDELEVPANLRINDQIKKYREECRRMGCERPYHHFAFGQSPFAPPPLVVEALRAHAGEHDYLPAAGLRELREAVARYYGHHFGVDAAPDRIVVSPGSKEMISILLAALEGPVLVPVPSWVSYMPQARILRKEVVPLRLCSDEGFKVTPELVKRGVGQASGEQSILILNHPHNPTGAMYESAELEELARTCREHGVVVIADEIYALTAFDSEAFVSMGAVYPEGTIVTGGLSKDRSAGGYRLGVGVFPRDADRLTQNVLKIAGSTYSCVAAPIQHAAIHAYSLSDDVESHVRDCAAINALVGEAAAADFRRIGAEVGAPRGAFYLFVDFNQERGALHKFDLKTSTELAEDVLVIEHVAMLPGNALLLADQEISFRCSYVDYDGVAALADWRRRPPSTPEEKQAFLKRNAPLVLDGIAHLGRYFEQVRAGKRPQHA